MNQGGDCLAVMAGGGHLREWGGRAGHGLGVGSEEEGAWGNSQSLSVSLLFLLCRWVL